MSQIAVEPEYDLDEIVNNLVTEDDEPVDNILSEKLQRLLILILYASWRPLIDPENPVSPRPFWASANVGIFFTVHKPLVPDVFISLDVVTPSDMKAKKGRSYLVWEQGKVPEVVVEIVSNKIGGELTTKLRDYAQIGVTYYVVLDPFRLLSQDLLRVYEPGLPRRFRLRNDYQLPDMGLSLTFWKGSFEGTQYDEWLRWCDADGNLLPTPQELADQAQELATQAQERAMQAEERAARLAAKLRELGVATD